MTSGLGASVANHLADRMLPAEPPVARTPQLQLPCPAYSTTLLLLLLHAAGAGAH
jgi:hypothetical protein